MAIKLDPNFKAVDPSQIAKNPAIIANAAAQGMTPEQYIESRGGVNASGYYGDSYGINSADKVSLTDEEYAAAQGTRTATSRSTINKALAEKIKTQTGSYPEWYIKSQTNADDATDATDDATDATDDATDVTLGGTVVNPNEGRQSAYDTLYNEFNKYGLGSLVESIKNIITDASIAPSQISLALQNTEEYKQRFSANKNRIKVGLRALSAAEYISKEDAYQEVMRRYGLPASYYSKDGLGKQSGFDQLLSNDVSDTELEDRIMTAQNRVMNSNPEVLASLKSFYPGITNGDILAYTLDPKNAIDAIKRKVTAAEIGGAAMQAGLTTGMTRAEELGAAGVTKAVAQEGFQTVAGGAPRGGQLASIYGQDPYTQTTAEKEVFGLAGKTEAAKQRKKITGLEKATFSGQSGATSSALVRDRAGAY